MAVVMKSWFRTHFRRAVWLSGSSSLGSLASGRTVPPAWGFHGYDSNIALGSLLDGGEHLGIVSHRVVQRDQGHVKHVQRDDGIQNLYRIVS